MPNTWEELRGHILRRWEEDTARYAPGSTPYAYALAEYRLLPLLARLEHSLAARGVTPFLSHSTLRLCRRRVHEAAPDDFVPIWVDATGENRYHASVPRGPTLAEGNADTVAAAIVQAVERWTWLTG